MPQKRKRKGHAASRESKQAKTDTSQDENRTQSISEVSEDTQNSLTQEPASVAASDVKEQEPLLTKEVGEKTHICKEDIKCDEAVTACNEPLVNLVTEQMGKTKNESDFHKCYTCDKVLQVVSKDSVILTDDINSRLEDGTSNKVDDSVNVDSPDEGFCQHSLSILQPGDYDVPLMDSSKGDIKDFTISESDRCDKEKSLSTSLLAPGLSEHDICKLTEAQGNTDLKPERDTFFKETDVNNTCSIKSSQAENLEEQDIVSENQKLELDHSNSECDHDSAILSPKKCITSKAVETSMSMNDKPYDDKDGVTADVTTGLSKPELHSFQQTKVSKRRNYGSDSADMLFLSQPTMSLKRGLDKDIYGSHRQIKKFKPPAKESKSRDICENSTKPTVAVDTNCLHSLNTDNINADGKEVASSVDSAVCVKQEDTKAAHPSSGEDLTIQTVENGKALDLAENVDQDTMAREGEMTEDKKMCGEMANKEKSLCVHDALVEVIKILVSDVSAKDDIDKTITTKAVDAVVPMHTKENFDNESEDDGLNLCQKVRPQDLSRTEEIDETEKLSHRVRVFAQRTDANGQNINDEASADTESICHGVRDEITEEETHDMISPKVPWNCIGKDNEKKETQVSCHSNQETSSQIKTGNTDASATLQDTSGVENVEKEELPIVATSVEVKHTEKKLSKNVSEHNDVHGMTDPDNHERQSSNLEHLQLSDYTTQIHDDTTHNGTFDDTTHKISHNNEDVSDGTSQKQLPSVLPDTTSHSDDGGTLLHEEKKTNSLYLGEVKCVTGDNVNVTEEKSEWTCSMTNDQSCDRENDKETFEGTQPFSTSTCTLYNDDNCLSNSYQEIQNKTQIISMPTQDYSTAATVDSVDEDLTGSNNNNNTTVDLTQKLTCQTSAKLPCEDFFADILNEFDMHSSKPPLDHSANSNSKQITISDKSVFADKAASCVDKQQSNTAVVTPKCQKMNTPSMTACVQTSSSKIIPKLLKTDPASASREANRINYLKDGPLNKTEDVKETPDEPLQQLPSDTVMDMSESQLCQLSREDIDQDFGSCIVSSNEEEGEHNNEKFETDFAQAQQKAVDEIVKKKTEGENLVSAIMKDLVSINKQLLRMKKEMETAKRKIAQQQQQHHQQQHNQPQYQHQQQHKPGLFNNGKSAFGFGFGQFS